MRRVISLIALFSCALGAVAQAQLPITEKVEWTWSDRPSKLVQGLPNVLIVGDSITRGYYPAMQKDLSGVANVYLFATSACSGDPRVPGQLPGQLHDYFSIIGVKFTVVHFNNGMHGYGYTEEQYAAGLPNMIAVVRAGAPEAKLIWATTTPLLKDNADPSGVGKGSATNARIDARNGLAAAIVQRERIPTDDLHVLMLKHQDLHSGDVHYTDAGYAIMAEQVTASIRAALAKQ